MDYEKLKLFLTLIFSSTLAVAISSPTNQDITGLKYQKWNNTPPNWKEGSDPCGNTWVGINCIDSRVAWLRLSSMGLVGQLSEDIDQLSELQILDLSYNKGLTGSLPQSIGNLKKLSNLILVGCSFSGQIPSTIGSLQELVSLSLNSNRFSGPIPPSIGNLSKVTWLDLTDNNIEGIIPISYGTTPGLDRLLNCKHFHLGKNKLTGPIPEQLFSSNMSLIHVFFDNNKLSGSIPSTLGLARRLEVVDLSNNAFGVSNFPSWFSNLSSLKTLALENVELTGQIPVELFSLPHLETVKLKDNELNGKLNIGMQYSKKLKLIDLQENSITDFENSDDVQAVQIILIVNPICEETGQRQSYCISVSQQNLSYATARNNCSLCSSDQISSPNCKCAYPYKGNLTFVAPSFSDLGNTSHYKELEIHLMNFFKSHKFSVDSISLSSPVMQPYGYLEVRLDIFPFVGDRFSRTDILELGFALSNQTYKGPNPFGPFFLFNGDDYESYKDEPKAKRSSVGTIGAEVTVSFVVTALLLVGAYFFCWKRRAEQGNSLVCWIQSTKSHGRIPELKGARWFFYKELKKYTNNFSEANEIGSGGYGKVYLGTLPTGELIAIKRAKKQSTMQGELQFKTEIELLSRVHHKNLVNLVGFCCEQGEQMLVYEYIPNGTLKDSISGKSGIKLNWRRRVKVALDTARGLAYLHELADPPVIHRDIKSTNVLLDNCLNAKVADFGLCKLMGDGEKDYVSTQVKGTLGYIDPEYYMTQQLTEKSDVYSFGVLMWELITARKPIERGRYIVREVRETLDKTKDLYNLRTFLDQAICFARRLDGFERFVDLALRCVEDAGRDRPTMSEVVKEIEIITQCLSSDPIAESISSSGSYEESTNEATSFHPYSSQESFDQRK